MTSRHPVICYTRNGLYASLLQYVTPAIALKKKPTRRRLIFFVHYAPSEYAVHLYVAQFRYGVSNLSRTGAFTVLSGLCFELLPISAQVNCCRLSGSWRLVLEIPTDIARANPVLAWLSSVARVRIWVFESLWAGIMNEAGKTEW